MHFIIYARDKKGAVERRMEVRPRHLEYWGSAPVKLIVVGPTLDEGSGDMNGSVLIVEADDLTTVRQCAEGDPYLVEGVFEKIDVSPVRLVLGEWVEERAKG